MESPNIFDDTRLLAVSCSLDDGRRLVAVRSVLSGTIVMVRVYVGTQQVGCDSYSPGTLLTDALQQSLNRRCPK